MRFPTELSHRQFRIKTRNGRWIVLPQISKIEKLWQYCDRFDATDVYMTATYFLNPKDTTTILGTDFIVDMDRATENDVLYLIKKVAELYNIKPEYILKTKPSNPPHWQVNFGKMDIQMPTDLQNRIRLIQKLKKDMFQALVNEGCVLDNLPDYKRVFRVPGARRIIDGKVYITELYPSITPLQYGEFIPRNTLFPGGEQQLTASSRYIINRKRGRYFPILYWSNQNMKQIKKEVLTIKERYHIKSHSIYLTFYGTYIVLDKFMSRKRCEKIMLSSTADNYLSMSKFGKIFMRIDHRVWTSPDNKAYIVDFKPQMVDGEDFNFSDIKKFTIRTKLSRKTLSEAVSDRCLASVPPQCEAGNSCHILTAGAYSCPAYDDMAKKVLPNLEGIWKI